MVYELDVCLGDSIREAIPASVAWNLAHCAKIIAAAGAGGGAPVANCGFRFAQEERTVDRKSLSITIEKEICFVIL